MANKEQENREYLNYSVYRGSFHPENFVGAFTGHTLPELEEMLGIKDLMVVPSTVCHYWMVAIGR